MLVDLCDEENSSGTYELNAQGKKEMDITINAAKSSSSSGSGC
jgi:hypothetical protein